MFMQEAYEWHTQRQGKPDMPAPKFPDWVLPEAGPSGHAHAKPAPTTPAPPMANQNSTPAAKEKAVPEKETVVIESEKEGEQNEGSPRSSSPVSSVGGVNSKGKEEASTERERESKSKNDEERKKVAAKVTSAGKHAATSSSPCKKRKNTDDTTEAEVPFHLPLRSTWTRRKMCATKPPPLAESDNGRK